MFSRVASGNAGISFFLCLIGLSNAIQNKPGQDSGSSSFLNLGSFIDSTRNPGGNEGGPVTFLPPDKDATVLFTRITIPKEEQQNEENSKQELITLYSDPTPVVPSSSINATSGPGGNLPQLQELQESPQISVIPSYSPPVIISPSASPYPAPQTVIIQSPVPISSGGSYPVPLSHGGPSAPVIIQVGGGMPINPNSIPGQAVFQGQPIYHRHPNPNPVDAYSFPSRLPLLHSQVYLEPLHKPPTHSLGSAAHKMIMESPIVSYITNTGKKLRLKLRGHMMPPTPGQGQKVKILTTSSGSVIKPIQTTNSNQGLKPQLSQNYGKVYQYPLQVAESQPLAQQIKPSHPIYMNHPNGNGIIPQSAQSQYYVASNPMHSYGGYKRPINPPSSISLLDLMRARLGRYVQLHR